ncbi:class I SAM-dependent methyltransferase [Nocardia arthritidis]|uniref:Class I SAM-dependent methyltransferase n=1 Tax=Nocardia arthritidis TaxID=228602 RepID=A0A6G9YRC3_9NOCA|nr:class I SAM-dependent methyltransferase [Nocardia arthritidis]QIS15566.1 class I SAM-dependent methyltransferase [Nocardia arthritidis]
MSVTEYLELIAAPADDDVAGWLYPTDAELLGAIDDIQARAGITGDILEIGAYHGKSAILLGYFARRGESLIVCDLFDSAAQDADNQSENAAFYPGLRQADFERNYLRFHPRLPIVHARPSAELGTLVAAGSCRLVHVDGGHTYDVAHADIQTARRLLGPGGVLAVDDWSSAHIPGVAMAFWSEYLTGRLLPLAFTKGKFYATWDPGGVTVEQVAAAVADRAALATGDTVPLGPHRALGVTMAPDAWRAYAASQREKYSKLYSGSGAPEQMVGF